MSLRSLRLAAPSSRLVALACGLAAAGAFANGYDESVSGDSSGNGLAPTSFTVGAGSNPLSGTSGRVAGVVDRDYYTFTVPVGLEWYALDVLAGTTGGGATGASFIGVEAGSQVTIGTAPATAAGLLGYSHYSPADIGSDILDNIGASANGASGFTPPLPAGTYSLWIQELSSGTYDYNFDLKLRSVPDAGPGAWGLVAFAGLAWTRRALRR